MNATARTHSRHCSFAILIFANAVTLIGCAHKAEIAPARLADPKTAALTFVRAIDQGDIDTAKAASIGKDQQQWVVAIATMSGGLRAAADAIDARYGGVGMSTSGGLRRAAQAISGSAVEAVQMADAQINEDTDTATISARTSFTNSRLKQASILKRDAKGLWRVDLPEIFKKYPILERERNSDLLKNYLSAGKQLSEIAKEIRGGKYPKVSDARDAIADRMGGQ